jgi:hypothetical protein
MEAFISRDPCRHRSVPTLNNTTTSTTSNSHSASLPVPDPPESSLSESSLDFNRDCSPPEKQSLSVVCDTLLSSTISSSSFTDDHFSANHQSFVSEQPSMEHIPCTSSDISLPQIPPVVSSTPARKGHQSGKDQQTSDTIPGIFCDSDHSQSTVSDISLYVNDLSEVEQEQPSLSHYEQRQEQKPSQHSSKLVLDASTICPHFPAGHQLNSRFSDIYQLEEELGSGGYGFVMTALHRAEGYEVAVKFIIKEKVPEHAWMEHDTHGKMPTEVLLLSFVDHKNIVKGLDLFDDEVFYYLVGKGSIIP